MKLVVMESPFAGDTPRNIEYARACLRDCIKRGEAPIASHLLFTQPGVLDDSVVGERRLGMDCGWQWMRVCDAVVVYTNRGISQGMAAGMNEARKLEKPIEMRTLEGDWNGPAERQS